jgi:hypothetical protein
LKVVYQTKIKPNSQKLISEIKNYLSNSIMIYKWSDVIREKRESKNELYKFFLTKIDEHVYCAFVID